MRQVFHLRLHRDRLAQEDAETAKAQWRRVADELRPKSTCLSRSRTAPICTRTLSSSGSTASCAAAQRRGSSAWSVQNNE
jgi:hypothetical protein